MTGGDRRSPAPLDAGQFLLGKIDAVTLLAASLAAHLSPAVASVLLAQCAALREKASRGEELSAYEQGFQSTESTVLQSLKQAADAEKIRALDGPAQH